MAEYQGDAGQPDAGAGDDDSDLADLLGVEQERLIEVLGAAWRREVTLTDDTTGTWFVAGEPPQLAVGIEGARCVLGRPVGRWAELGQPRWQFDSRHAFDPRELYGSPDLLRGVAEDIARRRRRTFRWCRTCRRLEAPEWFMQDEGVCMACASRYHGVTF